MNVYSGPELYYQYPDGNEVYNVTVAFTCHDFHGEIVIEKTEGRNAKFYNIVDLPTNLSYTIKQILEEYI